ncbi:MAG: hypothetical protein HY881_11730 [Deltaproteobacteria bacterium]|nr:hypothetical protein [Deltaproteobacteria bacterium]
MIDEKYITLKGGDKRSLKEEKDWDRLFEQLIGSRKFNISSGGKRNEKI